MKLRKRMAAIGAAMVMAVSMMSVLASASTPYGWELKKTYYQPTGSVSCTGYVYNLYNGVDTGIDFNCDLHTANATAVFDITNSMKYSSAEKARIYYAGQPTYTNNFKSSWYAAYKDNGYKCTVTGSLENDTSVTFRATGTAS